MLSRFIVSSKRQAVYDLILVSFQPFSTYWENECFWKCVHVHLLHNLTRKNTSNRDLKSWCIKLVLTDRPTVCMCLVYLPWRRLSCHGDNSCKPLCRVSVHKKEMFKLQHNRTVSVCQTPTCTKFTITINLQSIIAWPVNNGNCKLVDLCWLKDDRQRFLIESE